MSRDPNSSETQMVLWFSALIMVLFVIPALYAANAETINGKLLALAELQLKVFVPFSVEAGKAWEHITNLEAKTLSWEGMQAVLSYTGKWIRWPYALLLVLLGAVSIFMGRTGGLVRRLNMETLLQNNAESFACLRPIVGRGKYLLSPESYDTGCWRIARTPVQQKHPFWPTRLYGRYSVGTGLNPKCRCHLTGLVLFCLPQQLRCPSVPPAAHRLPVPLS